MDSKSQAEGERRVKEILFDQLHAIGLAKPSTVTNGQFAEMKKLVCAKLAYMTPENLAALSEAIQNDDAVIDRGRVPIGAKIVKLANKIQEPTADGSPLMRAVFADQVGKAALAEGWAPELLSYLRRERRWPTGYVINFELKKLGDEKLRRLTKIEEALANGFEPSGEDLRFRQLRLAAIGKCEELSNLGGAA